MQCSFESHIRSSSSQGNTSDSTSRQEVKHGTQQRTHGRETCCRHDGLCIILVTIMTMIIGQHTGNRTGGERAMHTAHGSYNGRKGCMYSITGATRAQH